MAKTLQHYRGYIIKATTPRDNTTFSHWICTRENSTEPEFEVDSLEEAKAWIDGTKDAEAAAKFILPKGYKLLDSKAKQQEPGYYIILAKRTTGGEFVTWEYNQRTQCYWGHYFSNLDTATRDFLLRDNPECSIDKSFDSLALS